MTGDPPPVVPIHAIHCVPIAGWQRCPVCDATGRVTNPDYELAARMTAIAATWIVCPTCDGKRIISTLTGRPPS